MEFLARILLFILSGELLSERFRERAAEMKRPEGMDGFHILCRRRKKHEKGVFYMAMLIGCFILGILFFAGMFALTGFCDSVK